MLTAVAEFVYEGAAGYNCVIMANTSSARKRARQAVTRRLHNVRLRTRLRTHVKKVIKAAAAGDKDAAAQSYREAVPVIDSSVNKKLIHRNKAARHKSSLNKLIRKLR